MKTVPWVGRLRSQFLRRLEGTEHQPGLAVWLLVLLLASGTPEVRGQATLQIVNHFSTTAPVPTDYFGANYGDNQVWLYFLNTGGAVTYTDSLTNQIQTVANATSIPLNTVLNGTFQLGVGSVSTKVFAGLGASTPFSGTNGPGLFDANVPYALTEWTINGNTYDNIDSSYIDQFSFPSKLTVTNSNGTTTSGFKAGTTAAAVVQALSAKMPTTPTGPANSNYPSQGNVGYGPLVPTVDGNSAANRWIGSSKYWLSAPNSSNLQSLYLYAPTFQDYMQYLQENAPTTDTGNGTVTGWYVDYAGNDGYSGFVNVTGNATAGFGLEVTNIRVNTLPSAANNWTANFTAGDETTGTITIAANGLTVSSNSTTDANGNWADATIYSGASLINDDFASGPIITSTGDFAANGQYNNIVATFLASISASMATGLLGSDAYLTAFNSATDPKGTDYWFQTLLYDEINELFAGAWSGGEEFFDPFWGTLQSFTDASSSSRPVYLSPFNDRWANFSPDIALVPGGGNQIVWELGTPIPEPGSLGLALSALLALGVGKVFRRRRRSE